MALELNVNSVKTALATDTSLTGEKGVGQSKELAPILGGKSLTVTDGALSDPESLVAKLKNENENAKMSVSQRRISILQTVLDSMNSRITEAQRDAILDIETGQILGFEGQRPLQALDPDNGVQQRRLARA